MKNEGVNITYSSFFIFYLCESGVKLFHLSLHSEIKLYENGT